MEGKVDKNSQWTMYGKHFPYALRKALAEFLNEEPPKRRHVERSQKSISGFEVWCALNMFHASLTKEDNTIPSIYRLREYKDLYPNEIVQILYEIALAYDKPKCDLRHTVDRSHFQGCVYHYTLLCCVVELFLQLLCEKNIGAGLDSLLKESLETEEDPRSQDNDGATEERDSVLHNILATFNNAKFSISPAAHLTLHRFMDGLSTEEREYFETFVATASLSREKRVVTLRLVEKWIAEFQRPPEVNRYAN